MSSSSSSSSSASSAPMDLDNSSELQQQSGAGDFSIKRKRKRLQRSSAWSFLKPPNKRKRLQNGDWTKGATELFNVRTYVQREVKRWSSSTWEEIVTLTFFVDIRERPGWHLYDWSNFVSGFKTGAIKVDDAKLSAFLFAIDCKPCLRCSLYSIACEVDGKVFFFWGVSLHFYVLRAR